MADREFETDAEREAFAAGLEEAAKRAREGKKLTVADVKKMTQEEIVDRMPEVRAALKTPNTTDTTEEGDDDEGES